MNNEDLLELIDLLLDEVSASKFREKFEGNDEVKLTEYLGLTDGNLKNIQDLENKNVAAVNLYFILNDDIKEADRDRMLEIIDKVTDKTILPKMVTNIFDKKKDSASEILEIFDDANPENYNYASAVITNDNIIGMDAFFDILEFVLETEDSVNAKYVFDLVIDKDIQENPDYLEIIKLISLAEEADNTKEAIDVIINERIQSMPEYLEVVKAILKAGSKDRALYAMEIALDEEMQRKAYYLELIKIIASASGDGQAMQAKTVSYDEGVMQREDYLEVVRLIANATDNASAVKALEIATNPKLQKKRKYLRLIEDAALDEADSKFKFRK